jgi:DNA polymerase-3 subunit beta
LSADKLPADLSADKPAPTKPTTPAVKAPSKSDARKLVSDPSAETGQQIVMRAGALKAALKNVDRARGKGSSIPVLSHILIESLDAESLRFTATDLNFTLWHLAQAKVLRPGKVCVPHLLGDLLARVNDDVLVTLTTDAQTYLTRIEAGRLNVSLKSLDAGEFPPATAFNGKSIVVGADMTHEAVNEIVKRIVPCVATDDSRPVLQGVHVSGKFPATSGQNVTLEFSSADGFRLAVLERDVTLHFDADQPLDSLGLIVPAKVFAETLKIATDEAKPIQFLFHLQLDKKGVLEYGMVQVETNAGGLRMNLIDGNFPDFNQIVPNPVPSLPYLPLAVEPALAALQRVNLISETHCARLTVKTDHVLIAASSADTGDVTEIIPATFDPAWQPENNFEIAFNADFLSDALRAASFNNGGSGGQLQHPIALRVTTSSAPGYIALPRYRHVMMPMHIGKDDSPKMQAKPEAQTEPQANTPKAETPKAQVNDKASAPQAKANGQMPKPNTKPAATANGKNKPIVKPVKPAKQKPN